MSTSGRGDQMPHFSRVTPAALRSVEFSRTVRGYDPAQVDEVLGVIQASLERASLEREALNREVVELRAELALIREDREAISAVLVDARRRADDLEATARADEERRRAAAREEAERLVADAAAQADATVQEAERTAEERIRGAEERAELLAEETRRHTEAELAQALEDVERHRAEAEHIAGLEYEMRAGYRAFLLTAFELVQRHPAPANGSGATQGAEATEPSAGASEQDEQRAEPPPEIVQEARPVTAEVA